MHTYFQLACVNTFGLRDMPSAVPMINNSLIHIFQKLIQSIEENVLGKKQSRRLAQKQGQYLKLQQWQLAKGYEMFSKTMNESIEMLIFTQNHRKIILNFCLFFRDQIMRWREIITFISPSPQPIVQMFNLYKTRKSIIPCQLYTKYHNHFIMFLPRI